MTDCKYTTDEIMEELAKLSEEYQKKLDQYPTAGGGVPFTEYVASLASQFESSEFYKMAQNKIYFESPYARYIAWYKITYGGNG